MRRITLAIVSTVAILVLLFSYRTSLGDPGPGGVATQVASEARVLSSGTATTTAATTGTTSSGGGAGDDPQQITAPDSTSGSTSSDSPAPQATASATPSSQPSTPTADTQTVEGAEEMTRYGAVQVDVTISGGQITDVQAVQYPDRERRDQEINANAIPELRNQVLSAQSANVAGVSGATYTTQGYLASVQSALDAAGFTP